MIELTLNAHQRIVQVHMYKMVLGKNILLLQKALEVLQENKLLLVLSLLSKSIIAGDRSLYPKACSPNLLFLTTTADAIYFP